MPPIRCQRANLSFVNTEKSFCYEYTPTLIAQLNVFIGTQCTNISLFPETILVTSAFFILVKYPQISSIIFRSTYVTTSPPLETSPSGCHVEQKKTRVKKFINAVRLQRTLNLVYTEYSQITFCILPTSTLRGHT